MNDEQVPYGLYEQLIDRALAGRLDHATRQGVAVEREGVDPGKAHDRVAAHLAHLLRHVIAAAPVDDRVDFAHRLVHDVIDVAARHLDEPEGFRPLGDELEMLLSVRDPTSFGHGPPRPHVPLTDHDLLVMGRDEPAVSAEIRRELASADQAGLLCAFITWPGFRVLAEPLTELVGRGGRFWVITTTYMGATERRALDELAQLGAEVKISYNTQTTRLHAKAWLFHRNSGLSTGYVGSSNLSRTAMLAGLEWNVRLSGHRDPALLQKFTATFDAYWERDQFEAYDPGRDGERFETAVDHAAGRRTHVDSPVSSCVPGPTSKRSSRPSRSSGAGTDAAATSSWPSRAPERPSSPRWTTNGCVTNTATCRCCSSLTAGRSSSRAGARSPRLSQTPRSASCWWAASSRVAGRTCSPRSSRCTPNGSITSSRAGCWG